MTKDFAKQGFCNRAPIEQPKPKKNWFQLICIGVFIFAIMALTFFGIDSCSMSLA